MAIIVIIRVGINKLFLENSQHILVNNNKLTVSLIINYINYTFSDTQLVTQG